MPPTLLATFRFALRWFGRAIFLLGFTVAAVTFLPVLEPWIHALTGPWTEARGNILVVLGSETAPEGLVGRTTYWRCIYAVRAWREGGFREIVVSGKGVSREMRDFMIGSGVPASAIVEEPNSTTTRENAVYVSEMLRGSPGPIVLLTSDFHMYRAWRAFRKCGLNVTPRPFPDAGKQANTLAMRFPVFIGLLQETFKIIGYRIRGWI